jgi:hypothetical protein
MVVGKTVYLNLLCVLFGAKPCLRKRTPSLYFF